VKSFSEDSPSTRNHRASTPGHTPGHSCYVAQGSIEFWGDIVHFASVQFPNQEITVAYDVDANAAAQRKKQFARRHPILVAGAHLPFPGVGHLRAADQVMPGCQWITAGVILKFIAIILATMIVRSHHNYSSKLQADDGCDRTTTIRGSSHNCRVGTYKALM